MLSRNRVGFRAVGLSAFLLSLVPLGCGLKDGAVEPADGGANAAPLRERADGPGMCAYAVLASGDGGRPQLWALPLAWQEVWPDWAGQVLGGQAPPTSDLWSLVGDAPDAVSAPTSVSSSRARTDVFFTTSAGTLGHTFTDDFGQTYHPIDNWGTLDGYKLVGRPDAASWADGRVDVICLAEQSSGGSAVVLAHAANGARGLVWDNWQWPATDADAATVEASSNPTLVAPEVGRLEAYVVGNDGNLWLRELDDTSPPYNQSTPLPWSPIPIGGSTLGASLDGTGWDLMATIPSGGLAHFSGVDPFNQQNWLRWPLDDNLATEAPDFASVSVAQSAGALVALAFAPTDPHAFWLMPSRAGRYLAFWYTPTPAQWPILGNGIDLTAW